MKFNGFTEEDFNVFSIDGLDARMEAIVERVRPKLDLLGQHFAPSLAVMTGDDIHYHVAKHARRSVNPPNDTWVAFASDKRGYKKHPHFQIGLWGTHLFIWFAMIYEAPGKAAFGRKIEQHIDEIPEMIPEGFVWSGDHMKPGATPYGSMSKDDLLTLAKRVQTVKKAELLCGLHLDRDTVTKMSGEELMDRITVAFETLLPLYKMS
ncbi:YktB family protein [Rossellomorea marisflavi]|uniref:YktB family protein n=1 Tax=Rossellomorea marisflavi TaxID=189381 RepID=UPI003459830B